MAYIDDYVLDNGLGVFTADCDRLDICTAEPATYAEATTTYTKGNKASPSCASPSAKGGGGREVITSAITDGSVTGDGTVTHWALVDTGSTRLLAAGSLSSGQAVSNGNTFTLTQFTVGIPGPA